MKKECIHNLSIKDNRKKKITLVLLFTFFIQFGWCQQMDSLLRSDQFLSIRVGKTGFKDARKILEKHSYKQSSLHTRSTYWRRGHCTTQHTLYSYIKIKGRKLKVRLIGFITVNRIIISSRKSTNLSFHDLKLGTSRIRELPLDKEKWERYIDSNGDNYMSNRYKGIEIHIGLAPYKSDNIFSAIG